MIDGFDFSKVDDYVNTQMRKLGIPGMALGIVYKDQSAHTQGFGVSNSSGLLITPQTPFRIGSISKSFTALAILQLAEAGKVELDTAVKEYLPWFALADQTASAQITVRQLLNQTSGLATTDGNRFWNSTSDLEDAVHQMHKIKLYQPVGKKWQYCNLNYTVLGLLVEKASGQTYADYVNEHIFAPLGMSHSYASRELAQSDGLSDGHYFLLGHAFRREVTLPYAYLPTGGLIASVEDMTHYAIAQLNGGQYGDGSVLSQESLGKLHAPAIPTSPQNHYAMGWMVSTAEGITTIKHNGDTGNFHGMAILQPEAGWAIVLLANASGFEQLFQVDEIAQGVLNLLNNKRATPVTLSVMFRVLYWIILLTPLVLILGIGYTLQLWRSGAVSNIWQVIFTVAIYITVAFFFLFRLPRLIPFPLSSLRVFYPELGYASIASVALGLGWSVIYLVLNLLA